MSMDETSKTTENGNSLISRRRLHAQNEGQQEYIERRNLVLQAAAKVFKEKGYRAASINAVAQAVGIDRASLYYYAAGKEELFHEVVREAVLSNVLMVEAISRGPGTPASKVEKFVVSLMASYEIHYPYLYVYVQEDMAQIAKKRNRWTNEMGRLIKRFNEATIAIVQAGLDDGSFKKDRGDARLIAFGIIGMCNWSHRWFKPGHGRQGEAVGKVFADMVLNGL
jgi:AcrR family transcriptional regulator